MITLGNTVRDMITGFAGIATGRSQFLYGCSQICITSAELKDGKPVGAEWFDEQRVALVEATERPMSEHSRATTGGPQQAPSRTS